MSIYSASITRCTLSSLKYSPPWILALCSILKFSFKSIDNVRHVGMQPHSFFNKSYKFTVRHFIVTVLIKPQHNLFAFVFRHVLEPMNIHQTIVKITCCDVAFKNQNSERIEQMQFVKIVNRERKVQCSQSSCLGWLESYDSREDNKKEMH